MHGCWSAIKESKKCFLNLGGSVLNSLCEGGRLVVIVTDCGVDKP